MSVAKSPSSSMMKHYRGKLPLSISTVVLCALAFIGFMYTESFSSLSSSSIFKFKSCSKRETPEIHSKLAYDRDYFDDGHEENGSKDPELDDRFDFDPEECNVESGKWVFNSSLMPLYSDTSCPYLDRQVSCIVNGRPEFDYLHWEWQPDDCVLPRFSPEKALKKLQGKRLMFVGDSLQRGQWQSLVCMVESVIPPKMKYMKRGRAHSVFKAKNYNATIEFYWAPFLVESNSDLHVIADPKKRILKVDSVAKHAQHWTGVDILVFNTYVWWMTGLRIKSLWGTFSNGEEGYEELDLPIAYRIGLKTWANWIDSNINPNTTRVFFTTMSPTHMRNLDWGNVNGIKCYNETKPVMKKNHWGSGSDKRIMKVVSSVVKKMKVPVTLLNITQMSEYRIDAHTSVYTETGGEILTDEQKANPLRHADCIHWCLPGVPDTWNQIFYAHL